MSIAAARAHDEAWTHVGEGCVSKMEMRIRVKTMKAPTMKTYSLSILSTCRDTRVVVIDLAYDSGLSTPPFLLARIQSVDDYSDGIANKREGSPQSQPLEQQLARSAEVKESIIVLKRSLLFRQRFTTRA